MFQPKDVFDLLRDQHVRNLEEDQCLVLALRMSGRTERVIGREMEMSPSSVHRRIEHLHRSVFSPLGLKPDTWLSAWWITLHRQCCTSRVFELVENSEQYFTERSA